MIDYNSDISVTRLDTGDIAYIRYEQTDDYPRLADRLRATAYNQARDLAQDCRTSLGDTVELLGNARVGLTDEEEALLDKIVDASRRAHAALQETFNGLQEWNQVEGRKALNERMKQQSKALKDLEESDTTSNMYPRRLNRTHVTTDVYPIPPKRTHITRQYQPITQ